MNLPLPMNDLSFVNSVEALQVTASNTVGGTDVALDPRAESPTGAMAELVKLMMIWWVYARCE
jgi:hypothetical protein